MSAVDPLALGLRQPDGLSCGPSSLVMARLLVDPSYAARVLGRDPQDSFRHEVLATHRRVTGPRDAGGRLQVPWPRPLGTPPWAVARELEALTGRAHDVRVVRTEPTTAYDALVAAADAPAVLFVGSRLLPRHVVLAVPGDGLRLYDPAAGRAVRRTRDDVAAGRLGLGSWRYPWFVVMPRT